MSLIRQRINTVALPVLSILLISLIDIRMRLNITPGIKHIAFAEYHFLLLLNFPYSYPRIILSLLRHGEMSCSDRSSPKGRRPFIPTRALSDVL